jgi:hypothetical protein
MDCSLTLKNILKSTGLRNLNSRMTTDAKTREDNVIYFSTNNGTEYPHRVSRVDTIIATVIEVYETNSYEIQILILHNIRKQQRRYHQNDVND